ncbi:MAG: HAMP domain-containing sensor histidine kinase [Hespellia sp.]|nr:HAMP domain-containing sensor histidine kinase [Hespellia sp.]
MFKIAIILLLLAAAFVVLLLKYRGIKQQIRSLSKQMDNLVCGTSEKMLDIALIDHDLEQLASILNQYNEKERNVVAHTLQHEDHLKESIANISHDLRTPLTVILGHLQILSQSDLTAEQKRRVDTALHKADRMKDLVADFYGLSLLDNRNEEPKRERINLSNLLIDMLTENAPAFEQHGLSPDVVLPEQTVVLLSDRRMIERIFQNLITNAIRYSAGNVKITLSTSENGQTLFAIENTLAQPDTIDVDRIFERFYTGDKSRHSESTGIGLAVVELLAKKLGAEVSATKNNNVLKIELNFKKENP